MRITMLPLAFYPCKSYFDLIDSVDHCVFIPDGKYAAQSINRTRLPDDSWLTLPVVKAGGNLVPLNEINIWWGDNGKWHSDMIKKIVGMYDSIYLNTNDVFVQMNKLPEYGNNLSYTLHETILGVIKYLNISTSTSLATDYSNSSIHGQKRAIQVCKIIGANEFIQPEWSKRYFDPIAFNRQGIKLGFYKSNFQEDINTSILDNCFNWLIE